MDVELSLIVDSLQYTRSVSAKQPLPPADVLQGRREQILQRRKEVQILTINRRKDYNQGLREFVNAA